MSFRCGGWELRRIDLGDRDAHGDAPVLAGRSGLGQ